jgi:hypothetical protein
LPALLCMTASTLAVSLPVWDRGPASGVELRLRDNRTLRAYGCAVGRAR